jgi:hypothetical protein
MEKYLRILLNDHITLASKTPMQNELLNMKLKILSSNLMKKYNK